MIFASCSIRLFILVGIFSSVCHEYVNCDCVQPPVEVTTVSLHPVPVTLNETHFLTTDVAERRALCKRIHVSERLKNKYAIFLPQDEDFYVAPAHGYQFNNGDDVELAIRCPTVPVMYILAENKDYNFLNYSIRIQKPRFGCYSFTFENVKEVNEGIVEDGVHEHRLLADSILIGTGVEDRWKLCSDARDLVHRYQIDWKSSPRAQFFRDPKLSRFWHSLRFDESEIRFAFHCPTVPDIYLSERPGSRNRFQLCNEILISVVGTVDDSP